MRTVCLFFNQLVVIALFLSVFLLFLVKIMLALGGGLDYYMCIETVLLVAVVVSQDEGLA